MVQKNWMLTNQLVAKLEAFQAELGKRILKLSKFTANEASLFALRWPTMKARILCRKLNFLRKESWN